MADFELVIPRLVPDVEHFSAEAFARRLEKFEGRAIYFVALPLPRGHFGARIIVIGETENHEGVIYPAGEYVIYADWLPPVHREHVKTHELAHIALGHPTLTLTSDELELVAENPERLARLYTICCRALTPDGADETQVLRDQEAEDLTRIIYQRVLDARHRRSLTRYSSQEDYEHAFRRLGLD